MQFSNGVTNMKQTPGILADTFADFPAPGLEGRIGLAIDTLKIYRDQGNAWVEYGGGGGGSQNWDQVLAQLGQFTASRDAAIAGFNFTMTGTAGKLIEAVGATMDVSIGDLTIGPNLKTKQGADVTNGVNWEVANSAFRANKQTALLTANRNYQWPDADGTIALQGTSQQIIYESPVIDGLSAGDTIILPAPASNFLPAQIFVRIVNSVGATVAGSFNLGISGTFNQYVNLGALNNTLANDFVRISTIGTANTYPLCPSGTPITCRVVTPATATTYDFQILLVGYNVS